MPHRSHMWRRTVTELCLGGTEPALCDALAFLDTTAGMATTWRLTSDARHPRTWFRITPASNSESAVELAMALALGISRRKAQFREGILGVT